MSFQLILIDDTERDWRIDDHTKEVGRQGIAEARAALRGTRRVVADDELAAPVELADRAAAPRRRAPIERPASRTAA